MNIIRRILTLSIVVSTILSSFAAKLYVDFVGEYNPIRKWYYNYLGYSRNRSDFKDYILVDDKN